MQQAKDILRVILLGTGIPNPDINAFGTATIIEAGSQLVLLDCGRGTVIRMAQLGIPLGAVDKVFLSHFHSDHYAGLFDLLMTGTIPQPYAKAEMSSRCVWPAQGRGYRGRGQHHRPAGSQDP